MHFIQNSDAFIILFIPSRQNKTPLLKHIKYLLIGLFFSSTLMAADTNPAKGKIKGQVIEEKSGEVIEYATIALYTAKEELITGTVSDHNGNFNIDLPAPGEYYLIVSFIGLESYKSDPFQVEERTINLGVFKLKSSSLDLEEFQVVGKQAAIEYHLDKKVINVDKQITSEAGSAVEVLENVPSVQVDVDGNVTLRGSSGFTVLIDGKPTILDPSDALRQIPSSSIENIEIITNPSVKYEPDGATGIINIVTKKNRLDGLSGIANANVGNFGQFGGDFQLSYRLNKFNFILGANYNKRARPGTSKNERLTVNNDTANYINSFGDRERGHTTSRIRGGIEYDISKNDFVSLSGSFGRFDMESASELRYDEYSLPQPPLSSIIDMYSYNSIDRTTRGGNYYSIDGVYQHTFPKKKIVPLDTNLQNRGPKQGQGNGKRPGFSAMNQHTLKVLLSYRDRNIDEESINTLRDLNDYLIGGQRNVENGPAQSLRLNIDYTLPRGEKDKFEAGGQYRSGESQDITELWRYDSATGTIDFIDEYSNRTQYYRNIYALYALYGGYVGEFGYQIGLRGEYMDRKIEMTGQDPFTINRIDYFPTVHISYNFPKDNQFMASYTRRISRPRSWWLEPFITWQDQFNVRQGNPALEPEYIDSYDVGYLKKYGDNFISLEGYYRVTHNKVERISSVYQDNVMLTRPENVGQDFSLGIEVMLNFGLAKWWDIEASGNFYNYKLEGEVTYQQGDDVYKEPLNRSSTNWNTRLNNTFQLWKNGVFQVSGRYNSASVTAQGTSSDYYSLDAAFKVSFLDKSLSANLQARNILGTTRREYISEGPDFRTYNLYEPNFPSVTLNLSYRFNNFRSKRNGNGGDDDDF